jgi:hypothetical protein
MHPNPIRVRLLYHKEVNKGFARFAYIIMQFISEGTITFRNQKYYPLILRISRVCRLQAD